MNKPRLIDANALNDALIDLFQEIDNMYIAGRVISLVNLQPTAYDIDKVIRELESNKISRNIINRDGVAIGCIDNTKIEIDDAIEIVKKGGAE